MSLLASYTTFLWLVQDSYRLKYRLRSSIPGGHVMHPSVPLEEKLENVPRGHGSNL